MFSYSIKSSVAAAFLATSTAAPAMASDLGAAIAGAIVGGAIVSSAQKQKQQQVKRQSNAAYYSATRAQNRETQNALNYFGFPAGTPDGVLGSRSRSAIMGYQSYVGFPATGRLSPYERDFLVSSYNRAQVGGPQVVKAMQTHQHGVRSLLTTWYAEVHGGPSGTIYGGMPVEVSNAIDEVAQSSDPSAEQLLQRSGFIQLADLNGDGKTDYILDTSVSGSAYWCGAKDCTVMVFASGPSGFTRNDFLSHVATPASFSCHQSTCRLNESATTEVAAAPVAPVAPAPTVPVTTPVVAQEQPAQGLNSLTLFETAQPAAPEKSLAGYCGKVGLLTSSNGGFTTVSKITDPDFVLSEQFCLARTYTVANGEKLMQSVQGATQAQVDQQCDAFGPVLAPYVGKLPTAAPAQLLSEVQSFVLNSNMSLEQLQDTAKICLFSAYRRDNMQVALGSALIMSAIGQKPYSELIAHHLQHGFGLAPNPDQAQAWYANAIEALTNGAEPVFAPGQAERTALLQTAVSAGSGTSTPLVQPAATLPTISLGD
ncbi:peptidoglycan-binding domain-containing protein [Shimia sp. MMG029]|uniref:peptidoglycan-binding domain-containing protein n=1 Tax=Shimia sp. MMG029 TaxID=3021978 RepID=UPI0022FE252A|nr:peptidoglycan-binding domain-containing protein [Shimia sp. MMG029]MDA5555451.1 peptidoglycan-binding domain-containing protein [Shimia sp. MMG029]